MGRPGAGAVTGQNLKCCSGSTCHFRIDWGGNLKIRCTSTSTCIGTNHTDIRNPRPNIKSKLRQSLLSNPGNRSQWAYAYQLKLCLKNNGELLCSSTSGCGYNMSSVEYNGMHIMKSGMNVIRNALYYHDYASLITICCGVFQDPNRTC